MVCLFVVFSLTWSWWRLEWVPVKMRLQPLHFSVYLFNKAVEQFPVSACLLRVVDTFFLSLATLIIISKSWLVSSLRANNSRARRVDLPRFDSDFSINEQTSAFLSVAKEWQDFYNRKQINFIIYYHSISVSHLWQRKSSVKFWLTFILHRKAEFVF